MSRRASGEGSVGKRPDGTYYGAIRIEGKRHWAYGSTKKEVADKLKALQQKSDQGISLGADKVTVEDFLTRWLEEVIKPTCKFSTYRSYRQMTLNHINPAVGKLTLAALRPDHIQQLVNALHKENKAPRTIRNVRAALRKALNQAIRWRYITFNAASLVETPRIEKFSIQPFTTEEARVFLTHIKGHKLEVLFLLALLLGLREGELLALQFSDFDLAKQSLTISGTLQWRPGTLVRETAKTNASHRTLPLPASVIPLLTAHMAQQRERFPQGKYLFTAARGGPLSPFTLVPQFKALLESAGLRPIRFHDLRHSCATFLIARGEHPRTVMDILGHSQISTTMNIYGHTLDETRTSAIKALDSFLGEED